MLGLNNRCLGFKGNEKNNTIVSNRIFSCLLPLFLLAKSPVFVQNLVLSRSFGLFLITVHCLEYNDLDAFGERNIVVFSCACPRNVPKLRPVSQEFCTSS